MCGICGILYIDGTPAQREEVVPMLETLLHRGPDQGDIVVDGSCALGNRRLAILDLSPNGALPMRSADDRLIIAYNGEIYNHPILRHNLELEGARYRSGSDTETLLKLYRRNGVDMLRSLRGMYAFALWDRDERRLLLARDRMGEKPLYYYADDRVIVFASEIKALLAHPAVPQRIGAGRAQAGAVPGIRLHPRAGDGVPGHQGADAGALRRDRSDVGREIEAALVLDAADAGR
ncbi:MAG: hypothetical protein U0521_06505 [Anaerolineae bacterium]